jgi:nucleoside-diphosphate-sugar epimerase
MTKILITGGAGFIPSSLADELSLNPDNFIVLVDNLSTGTVENICQSDNCIFIKCDVNNFQELSAVMIRYGFDYVFHYAAVVGVLRTLNNPKMVLNDILGLENVFSLSKNTGVRRLFYSSSSEVYGEPVHLPQHEYETPLNSKLPYAVVKNLGECYCRTYKQEYNLDYTILRFFNTYGPKQSQDFVMSKFIRAALKGEDITIYGDGSQTRTFCFIDDNISFTKTILEEDIFVNDVVNVGNDRLTTIRELAETIIRKTNSKSAIRHLPPLKEGDMTRRQPDISRMRSVLNRELVTLDDGIETVLRSWTQKEKGINQAVNQFV